MAVYVRIAKNTSEQSDKNFRTECKKGRATCKAGETE